MITEFEIHIKIKVASQVTDHENKFSYVRSSRKIPKLKEFGHKNLGKYVFVMKKVEIRKT